MPDEIIIDGTKLDPGSIGDMSWLYPSKQWEAMDDAVRKKVLSDLDAIGFPAVKENWESLEAFFADREGIKNGAALAAEYNVVFMELSNRPDLYINAVKYFPQVKFLYDEWRDFLNYVNDLNTQAENSEALDATGRTIEDYLNIFGNGGNSKFAWAGSFMSTQSNIGDWLKNNSREETPPPNTRPYQMRLGGSRFYVPPINIEVGTTFRSGGLTGSAIRQVSSPKFNTGHSDTTISMTLYFPNQESIWGIDGMEEDIDFDNDSDEKIDRFMSSLRGLIAQFRYSPIVPVRNEYLNRTYGITAVALQSMTVQTLPKYPFCVAVHLELLNFNHKVFLPMISDFNEAVLWGRFRQYIGRAAQKMNSYVNQGFLVENPNNLGTGTTTIDYENAPSNTFSKVSDMGGETVKFLGITKNFDVNPNKFTLYYPRESPARVFAPDTASWRQPGEDDSVSSDESLWGLFLSRMGYDLVSNPEAIYDHLKSYDPQTSTLITGGVRESNLLIEYLEGLGITVDGMNDEEMDKYIDVRIEERRKAFGGSYTPRQEEEDRIKFREMWFYYAFTNYISTPLWKQYLEAQEAKRQTRIKEWEVPMVKLDMDWTKVIVTGVTASLGNNFVRHQLQMQAEPTLQHIGGRDSTVSVAMTVFGEDELIRLRRVFDHISGLARLEHAHGVLGFLGIKNTLTTLCGMKYVIPLSFNIETIPNNPHVYSVQLNLVDFDVFQQKREELSSEQQVEFIEAFGKRNPFLRIKQLWNAFNAYPDFPLAIYDDKEQTFTDFNGKQTTTKGTGKVIGHLDPDFYFKAFQTIDDDLVNQNLENRPGRSGDLSVYDVKTGRVEEDANKKLPDDANPNDYIHPSAVDAQLEALTPDNMPNSTLARQFYMANELDMKVMFPLMGEDQNKISGLSIRQGDVGLGEVDMETGKLVISSSDPNNPKAGYGTIREDHAAQSVTIPNVKGNTPLSGYAQPTMEHPDKSLGANDPMYQVELMMEDMQYRDTSGRMIRAYPTFMLWLIDEGGNFAGVKLFDNFYGLQSVIDFSVHESEDSLGDTLVLRLSNLYSKLDSQTSSLVKVQADGTKENLGTSITDLLSDPNTADEAIDRLLLTKLAQGEENLRLGTQNEYIRELGGIRLKPGIRVHLRIGYSANPNSLDTVFNGTITQVTSGDIVEVIAQSDAIELAPYINTTDKGGHSGKIDGALNTGLWLSEPRDLMVRLLSMGSSTFRESFAHATQGMIFSENKFGIRHFGSILYEPLTDGEKKRSSATFDDIEKAVALDAVGLGEESGFSGVFGNVNENAFDNQAGTEVNTRGDVASLMSSLWVNSFRHRDYELFKRNIYPGNGTGVGQYLGGDFPEAGLLVAQAAGSEGKTGSVFASPVATQFRSGDASKKGSAPEDAESDSQTANEQAEGATQPDDESVIPEIGARTADQLSGGLYGSLVGGIFNGDLNQNPILSALGITSIDDDDLKGFDEVSFRAQTYMKSVWDMFKMCSYLLPNYIVAVRPFEDRSTVFYGKPHWLYTSGLVPITTGVPKDDPNIKPIGPDTEQQDILRKIRDKANPLADFTASQNLFASLTAITPADPALTTAGLARNGNTVTGDTPQDKTWNFFLQKGFTPEQIAGVMGNIELESGGYDPAAIEGGSGEGFGLIQWSFGRKSALFAMAESLGEDPKDVNFQLSYIWHELTGSESAALGPFQETNSVYEATDTWMRLYERPNLSINNGHFDLRLEAATRYYEEYTNRDPKAAGITGGLTSEDVASSAEPELSAAARQEQALIDSGADPESVKWFTRGFLDENVNIWSVTSTYQDYISNPDTAKNAAKTDPVGHFARLLYDREYAIRFKNWVADGSIGSEGMLGQADANFLGVFEDLGALDNKDAGENGGEEPKGPGEVLLVAEAIWDQFRHSWGIREEDIYGVREDLSVSPWGARKDYIFESKERSIEGGDYEASELYGYSLNDPEYYKAAGNDPEDSRVSIWDDAGLDGVVADDLYDYLPTQLVGAFKRFMWQDPYARAWLIVTTTFNTGLFSGDTAIDQVIETAGGIMGAINGGIQGDIINFITDKATAGELCDFGESRGVRSAWKKFLDITYGTAYPSGSVDPADLGNPDSNSSNPSNPNWTNIADRNADGSHTPAGEEMIKWLRENDEPGKKSTDPIDRAINDVKDALGGTIGRLLSVAGNTLQGLVGMMREMLSQLGLGLNMVGQMQRQAQIMNKVFNDSIYYAEGGYLANGKPDLVKLVDNPFTREYGEPVVEVREPFQRLHYIDSYRHIINNGIQENLNNVPTVVTASSDGKYPVSVYFDKGLDSHLQNEVAIETGLFWDNANGEGFFSFLHPLFHPIEKLRGDAKIAEGSSDELLSKRVATAYLKEGLKDIYSGEITILGDPDIRSHDLLYIADVYERIYGLVEVESVTHHFTPETGFITGIVPNALVIANDPARWAMHNWLATLFGAKNLRDETRHHLQVFADDSSYIKKNEFVGVDDLAQSLKDPILGHTTYTGGASAVIKDIASAKATGLYLTEAERLAHLKALYSDGINSDNSSEGGLVAPGAVDPNNPNFVEQAEASQLAKGGLPAQRIMADFVWGAWDWVRDNLLDQHSCYIQYLTKDGQAMDAGLSYAQGVAVGRFHTINILPGILGVPTSYKEDGHIRITTNDLLQALGWNEIDIATQYKQVSWWVAQTNADILGSAGKSPDGNLLQDNHLVSVCRVSKIEDGDTIHVHVLEGDALVNGIGVLDEENAEPVSDGTGAVAIRLTGTRVFELSNHNNPEYVEETDAGLRARNYLESLVPVGTIVVVRQVKNRTKDDYGRSLGVVFHNVPAGTEESKRTEILMRNAGRIKTGVSGRWGPAPIPGVSWDGYADDGLPYTLNWQMIMAGYGDVDMYGVGSNDKERGAITGPVI